MQQTFEERFAHRVFLPDILSDFFQAYLKIGWNNAGNKDMVNKLKECLGDKANKVSCV